MGTPRTLAAPPAVRLLETQRSQSFGATHVDNRYPSDGVEGPRPPLVGMEWRRRRTAELDMSRGAGGGVHCANTFQMRSAGLSTKHRGDIIMRDWCAYKQS